MSRATKIEQRLRGLEEITRTAINAVAAATLPLETKIHYNILICGISKGLSASSLQESWSIFVKTYSAVAAVQGDDTIEMIRQYLEDAIEQYRLASRHNVPLHGCKGELLFCIKQLGLCAK